VDAATTHGAPQWDETALRRTNGGARGYFSVVHRDETPPPVEVRRSRRRVRTVTAYREGDGIVVAIPARFSAAQEREWVARMVERLARQERRRRPSDHELMERAGELSRSYLGGRARPVTVSWATNQGRRWGSCTPADGSIRISTRVQGMPRWVIDYVLLHELAHLMHPGHGPSFWALLDSYPHTEKARGFLEGYAFSRQLGHAGHELGAELPADVGDGNPPDAAPPALVPDRADG